MKNLTYCETWPESWKYSYPYDCLEIYGQRDSLGYAYAYRQRVKHTIDLIQSVAKPGAKILDIAAAQGNFSLHLAELGYEVTWNDLREDLIDYVKKVAEFVKPGGHIVMTTPNGEYFYNRLPRFSDCSNPEIFESVQFKPNSDGHIFLLHKDAIYQIAQAANLTVKKINFFTNPLTNGHIKTWLLLKFLPRSFVDWLESLTQQLPLRIRKRISNGTAVLIECKG